MSNKKSVREREVKIQSMRKASKKASGRTRKSLAFPEMSLIVPTFSAISSNSEARKYVSPRSNTLEVSPPRVGRTTPYPIEIERINRREIVFLMAPTVTTQVVIPIGRTPLLLKFKYSKYHSVISKRPSAIISVIQFWIGMMSLQNLIY
ncbi:Os11g0546150 [Oryza sativa Japonica Group]|uniref:Os11g0546150 protein n=1 Tax=Oryza sativa subsp. japonica TaxID=39947 RepID=A0A0P0Y362_ORYSJ|nr:hypothetical protein EE612_056031 [Oryza sativa]BAT14381.1 Os11g0546150 [Oryza sativa Japonica Group]